MSEDTPPAAPQSPPERPRRPTTREWVDRFEADAAACTSRREASELLLRMDTNRAQRFFHGEALRRVHVAMLSLYDRFWGGDRTWAREPPDYEENNL